MDDFNNPNENNNNLQPNEAGNNQSQNQELNNQQQQYTQPQYQQPQYQGSTQYQQPNQQQNQQQYQQPNQQQQQYQYQQPNQQSYTQYPYQAPKRMNPLALASLICGIGSFLFSCCFQVISILGSLAGLVLGILYLKDNKVQTPENKNQRIMAIVGIVLSGIGILLAIVILILAAVWGNTLMNEFYNAY